jgi:FMN phosphatase YigB (HAD superfamily)
MKTILVDAGGTLIIKGIGIYQPMHDFLEQYPNRKIIVSNVNDEEIEKYGFTNLPYELFTLKHNPDKTDAKYFIELLEHYDLNKNDVIHFDHVPEAVESAKSLDIVSYFYDPDKKDLKALKSFLDKNL